MFWLLYVLSSSRSKTWQQWLQIFFTTVYGSTSTISGFRVNITKVEMIKIHNLDQTCYHFGISILWFMLLSYFKPDWPE